MRFRFWFLSMSVVALVACGSPHPAPKPTGPVDMEPPPAKTGSCYGNYQVDVIYSQATTLETCTMRFIGDQVGSHGGVSFLVGKPPMMPDPYCVVELDGGIYGGRGRMRLGYFRDNVRQLFEEQAVEAGPHGLRLGTNAIGFSPDTTYQEKLHVLVWIDWTRIDSVDYSGQAFVDDLRVTCLPKAEALKFAAERGRQLIAIP